MSTRRVLGTAGDIAQQLLRLTAASSNVFPPLKNAATCALRFAEIVGSFRTKKELWKELGAYVQHAVAGVVACSAQTGDSQKQKDIKTRLEGLEAALSVSIKIIEEEQAQSRATRMFRFLKEPELVMEIRKRIDDAVALFELNAINLIEINVQKTFEAVVTNSQRLFESVSGIAEDTAAIVASTHTITVKAASISRKASLLALNATLQKLHCVSGASWDIYRTCMPNTRTETVNQILEWVDQLDETNGGRIFLLTAVAGAGKSTIAHTVAHHCHERGQLVSSFFFDRQTQGRNKPTLLFSTITKDLSAIDQHFAASVSAAIERDQSLPSAPVSRQFEELFLRPSRECSMQRPLVIVIDAMDEGWDMDLLKIFRERVGHLPSGFRIFITSRMRPELDVLCRQAHVHWMNMEINTPESMSDMSLFVPHMLRQLAEAHNLGEDWPGEQLRRKFEERAEGLFLWVVIVCQFLHSRSNPTREFTKLLSSSDHSVASAEARMDTLYATILDTCNWDDEDFVEDYHRLMGVAMATKTPLTMDALKTLFHEKPLSSNYTRQKLSPLLAGTREQDDRVIPVRVLHQSLHDFLVTRASGTTSYKRFRIVEKTHSQELALLCINALNRDLNEHMSGVGYLSEGEKETPGIPKMKSEEMPEALWYACRFWMDHLVDVDLSTSPGIQDAVFQFMNDKVIIWMEALTSHGRFQRLTNASKWAQGQLSMEMQSEFDSYKPKLAEAYLSLSNRLRYEGRQEEALKSIEESVELHQQLWTNNPNKFGPNFAGSLNNFSVELSTLGRPEEALKVAEQSVEMYRQLWADRTAGLGPDFAMSLNNLSNRLSDLGRREEALKIVEESVELYRQLSSDRTPASVPDLAGSLSTLSLKLSSLGRLDEALKAVEESVELYRQLWAGRPAVFGPELALSLNTLSAQLSSLGRREDALKAVEESVELYRSLWSNRTAALSPYLALSVTNLSSQLSKLGRREDALKAAEESVELYRQLWADRPAEFAPDFALSLNNFSIRLSSLGRREEALKAAEESVELRRKLWADHPTAFSPSLARSLNALANHLSDLRRYEEALEAVEESVQLFHQLWTDRPAAFTPDLALCLHSLSNRLSSLGRREEALKAVKESVELYRQLWGGFQAAFSPNLAYSLDSLSVHLSSLNRHEEALKAVEESVELRRQLWHGRPDAFSPDLSTSLYHYSSCLRSLNRQEEALKAAQESVFIRRSLAKDRPAVFLKDLSDALDMLSLCLESLGRNEESLAIREEHANLNARRI